MVILSMLCLILSILVIRQESREKYIAAAFLKGLASLSFVMVGLMAGNGGQTTRLIVLGLIFGCIADILLNLRSVFQSKGQMIFLLGILGFLSGHIIYLAAILPMAENVILCISIGIILTAVLMAWIFTKITANKAFKIFGVIYIAVIVILNCAAVSSFIALQSPFTGLFCTGTFLFLISDIVLILNTFGKESRLTFRYINLILYYSGQLLIAWSLLLAV